MNKRVHSETKATIMNGIQNAVTGSGPNMTVMAATRATGSLGAEVPVRIVHSESVATKLAQRLVVAEGRQSFSAARLRQVDYSPGGIFDPLFSGLSAHAAGINAAICHHPYLRR
jgi:hypothetical protein